MTLRLTGPMLMAMCAIAPRFAFAEPYLAVQNGLQCSACHVNYTGGGKRNSFGTLWGQTTLPASTPKASDTPWTGEFGQYVGIGADLRAAFSWFDQPDTPSTNSFDLNSLRAYLDLHVIPGRLDLYVDQRLAPGTSTNAEAWLRLDSADHRFYLKAGQMYLPYGFRLQDDGAYVRERTGINFNTPDRGIEAGFNGARWAAQFAISNGTAGAPEVDKGKQWSLRGEYVQARWRAGASFNLNEFDSGTRRMQGLFMGLKTGPVAWLAEVDLIVDPVEGPDVERLAGLVEANWMPRKGHNIKFTAERYDPDLDASGDPQTRLSLLWEYTPMPFLQVRAGVRQYDDNAGVPSQNQRMIFLQLHGYL